MTAAGTSVGFAGVQASGSAAIRAHATAANMDRLQVSDDITRQS
jgi:hypothetical protein